jgi:hypothetical protein
VGTSNFWESGGATKLLLDQFSYFSFNLAGPWIQKAIRFDHFSLIDIDAELAKPAFYQFHLCVRFIPQLGCHTGSHRVFDGSNRTVMDHNFLHCFSHPFPSGVTMACDCFEPMV